METQEAVDLELNIARARLILAPATLLSVFLDAATPDLASWLRLTGGFREIDRYALVTLLVHLLYASTVHAIVSLRAVDRRFVRATVAIDVGFAIVIALFTEGPTSPSYAFFTFAIVAIGCREGFRATLAVVAVSLSSYLGLILLSGSNETRVYLMRPVYLGITGYLIGYLGEQRKNFEMRVRDLEMRQERHSIARSLHDGYVQALAGVNLRLTGCRQLLQSGNVQAASAQLADLQIGVAREYDEVRCYIRSLIDLEHRNSGEAIEPDTVFDVHAEFRALGARTEQVLLILLEGVRNTMQHAAARSATVSARMVDGKLAIDLRDDGVGFAEDAAVPWAIASRATELGGEITMDTAGATGTMGKSGGSGARLRIEIRADELP